jgi:hypothetical protein
MWKGDVSTHGDRWGGLCLGGDIQRNPNIVIDTTITMLVWRRGIIRHIVVEVLQALWLTLCSGVFDRWGPIYPVLV